MNTKVAFAGPLIPPTYLGHTGKPNRWPTGRATMPLIPPHILDGAPFLFRTKQEADARVKMGGTCFCVSKTIPGSKEIAGRPLSIPYLVTCRHVVYSGGASVVSINRADGGKPAIFDYEPTDWTPHPTGDDVAAICVFGKLKLNDHLISHTSTETLVTEPSIKTLRLGVGDEVFMVGRFINHQGHSTNRTAARFGSLSMMQEKIWVTEQRRYQESFAVEMRSRTGFSGSPVVLYRTPATVLADIPIELQHVWAVLGVNWGYILDDEGENTWLNGVVPAWKITETLNAPTLKDRHQELTEEFHRKVSRGGKGAVSAFAASSAPQESDDNPNHREDFIRLVDVAARKRPQGDQT
jgi:Trypsin-like peptidase domain